MDRARSIAGDVKDWIEASEGWFYLGDIDKELQIVTKADKAARGQEIHRLVESKKLRRDKNRQGRYKKLHERKPMEWWTASKTPLDLWLPFGLSDDSTEPYIRIFSGNIIICAGMQDSGKTLMAYEFANNNISTNPFDHKIQVVVSEQDRQEVRVVLEDIPMYDAEAWREHVDVWPKRGSDWADMVVPNAINIFDYVTDYDEAWNIGRQLRDIYDAIEGESGVVWVNLQKDYDRDTGRGGPVTKDIPRLYLSISCFENRPSEIKIIKGKFKRGKDPKGMKHKFDISDDGTIVELGSWYGSDWK
jgi:hypothetical protein